jgi:hypothetical protein
MTKAVINGRLMESAQLCVGVILVILEALKSPYATYANYAMIYCLVVGALTEYLRAIQLIVIFSYLVYSFNLLVISQTISTLFFALSITFVIVLNLIYGQGNFEKYPKMPEAPFKVGYKTFRTTNKHGNEVHVYYPISKNTDITNVNNPKWLPHGEKTISGILMLAF